MILAKKPDIDRFLAQPGSDIRAVLLYGKDRAVVRERADLVAAKSTQNPDDPFDVAVLTETDLSNDSARLVDELAASEAAQQIRLEIARYFASKKAP